MNNNYGLTEQANELSQQSQLRMVPVSTRNHRYIDTAHTGIDGLYHLIPLCLGGGRCKHINFHTMGKELRSLPRHEWVGGHRMRRSSDVLPRDEKQVYRAMRTTTIVVTHRKTTATDTTSRVVLWPAENSDNQGLPYYYAKTDPRNRKSLSTPKA